MRAVIKYIILIVFFCGAGYKPVKRSKPPESWDKFTLSLFSDDAFLLSGDRPDNLTSKINDIVVVEQEKPVQHNDFDISDMMTKLEAAQESIESCFVDKKTFEVASSKIDSSADIFLMMSKTLCNSNPEYDDPDTFLKLSEKMKENAQAIKIFTKQKQYKETKEAFVKLKKNCNDCHVQYRL